MKKPEYTGFLGSMGVHWKNPPPPFNPMYDPKANARRAKVTESMERDGVYQSNTRDECAKEWARRYDELKSKGE